MGLSILGAAAMLTGQGKPATVSLSTLQQLEQSLDQLSGQNEGFKSEAEFKEKVELFAAAPPGMTWLEHHIDQIYEDTVGIFIQHLSVSRDHLDRDLTEKRVKHELDKDEERKAKFREVLEHRVRRGHDSLNLQANLIVKMTDVSSVEYLQIVQSFTRKLESARAWLYDHFGAIGQCTLCPEGVAEYINDWKMLFSLPKMPPATKGQLFPSLPTIGRRIMTRYFETEIIRSLPDFNQMGAQFSAERKLGEVLNFLMDELNRGETSYRARFAARLESLQYQEAQMSKQAEAQKTEEAGKEIKIEEVDTGKQAEEELEQTTEDDQEVMKSKVKIEEMEGAIASIFNMA